jgi:hypothetical protein
MFWGGREACGGGVEDHGGALGDNISPIAQAASFALSQVA